LDFRQCKSRALRRGWWQSFVFSALVDGDFLDTERFYAGGKDRDLGAGPSLDLLKSRLGAARSH